MSSAYRDMLNSLGHSTSSILMKDQCQLGLPGLNHDSERQIKEKNILNSLEYFRT